MAKRRPDLSGNSHVLGMLYCGLYDKTSDNKDFIYICYNMHWQNMDFALPKLPDGLKWKLLKSSDVQPEKTVETDGKDLKLQSERSVCIYISEIDKNFKKKKDRTKKNGKN